MRLDRPIDITAEQRKTVLALLASHLPNTTAWVYGSRVKWTSSPKSDLDLVVFATPEQAGRVSDLREAFEESNLLFRVDLFVWDEVPEQFRRTIEAEHVVLVERREADLRGKRPTVQLGEVVDLLTGFPFKSNMYVNDPDAPRLLRGDNIGQGTLRWSGAKRWSSAAVGNLAPFWLREGDVVLAMDRPWIEAGLKYSAVRTVDLPALLVQRVARLRGNTRLDTRFLNYVIGCRDFTEYVISVQTGTAVPHISARQIKEFEFPLLPLPEQRSIAHVLGTLDDKIELNRRMNQTLEEMARALFKCWFVDFDPVHAKATLKNYGNHSSQGGSVERARAYLDRMDRGIAPLFPDSFVDSELGPIPNGWEVKRLGELCNKPEYGYTASATNEPVGPKFLRITDINKKAWLEWESVPYCQISEADFEKYRLNAGDILIARMADPGHGCMIEEVQQAVFASYLIRFRPVRKLYARLLQYWLRSDAYWGLVRGQGGGTTRVSLNAKVLREFSCTVPSCHLMAAFAKQVDGLRARVVANSAESRTLTALRNALLPKLVSGELRVKE